MGVQDYSTTPASNVTVLPGVGSLAENVMQVKMINDAIRRQLADLAQLYGDTVAGVTTTGTGAQYLVTLTGGHSTYDNRVAFRARFHVDCTGGATTVNVNGRGAKALKIFGTAGVRNPIAGEIKADMAYDCVYVTALNCMVVTGQTITFDGAEFTAGVHAAVAVPLGDPVILPAGTPGAPSLTTTGDLNTGLYFPAANTVVLVAGGAERLGIGSAGQVRVSGTTGAVGQVLTSGGGSGAASWTGHPFSTSYTSTDQTITSGGLRTLAHGLGQAPKFLWGELVCQTAEQGYAVGDVVAASLVTNSGPTQIRANSVTMDDTNIHFRFSNDGAVFLIGAKGTGAAFAITPASWNLRLRAFA